LESGRTRTEAETALSLALRWLARRQHAEAELEGKLRGRGISAGTIASTLARLRELGYLDDREFARALVAERSRRRGPALIASELVSRGIAPELAAEVLAEIGGDRQMETARRLLARRPGRTPRDLAAWLLRQGFPREIVQEVMGEGVLDPFSDQGGSA
jgi:regulatory protein